MLALIVLSVTRRLALVPLLFLAATMPVAQRVVIGGADFTVIRLLLLVYIIRVLFRHEWEGFLWNRLDKTVLLWVTTGSAIMVIHFGSIAALVNRLGWAYDVLLVYFCSRVLIRGWDDIVVLARSVAIISVPLAIVFIHESITQYNVFHIFGGVAETTWVREGRMRCQGPYAHPIIAGTFWAALLPLIWTLWKGEGKSRVITIVGTLCAFTIILASASSTPFISAIVALMGLALFSVRQHRTRIWIGFFGVVFALHLVMKAPVWHLMSRVSFVGGSTGWHRFIIFDTFVNHFGDWYLTGYATPMDWRWEMRDPTNQFVAQGLDGGVLTLVLFVAVLCFAFGNVGRLLKQIESSEKPAESGLEWRTWLIGVAIFVHVVTFLGLTYFGQMSILWHLQLSFAGAIGAGVLAVRKSDAAEDRAAQPPRIPIRAVPKPRFARALPRRRRP